MSEYLSGLIAIISANAFSNIFLFFITVTLICSLYLAATKSAKGFVQYAPNLMTSLGVLGTFSGIVVGLMQFNPENIDESIVLLLSGLKTAFLTSLVGMSATILFKVIVPFLQTTKTQENVFGPAEMHAMMNKQLEAMESQVNVIGGNEDSSLASQIRLLRMDMNEGNNSLQAELVTLNLSNRKIITSLDEIQDAQNRFREKLWLKIAECNDTLSKLATEPVVEAMRDVILDFNNKLTDQVVEALKEMILDFNDKLAQQFGNNFKHLDGSVKQLVEWQENYREQLKEMAHKYKLGVDTISLTEKALVTISERTEAIPGTMEKLCTVMELTHGQVIELEERLDAFKELRVKAVDAMPKIQLHLDRTISSIGNSVREATSHYQQMLLGSKEMMEKFTHDHRAANTEFARVATEKLRAMSESVQSSVGDFTTDLHEKATHIGSMLTLSTENIANNMSKATGDMQSIATEIATHSEEMRDKLGLSVTEINGQVLDFVTTLKNQSLETTEILVTRNQALNENTVQVQKALIDGINALKEHLQNILEELLLAQFNDVKRTFEGLEGQLITSVDLTGKAVEKQVQILDTQMKEEVTRVVSEMGQALATVTQQFTRDYTHLTKEMGKVINSVNSAAD